MELWGVLASWALAPPGGGRTQCQLGGPADWGRRGLWGGSLLNGGCDGRTRQSPGCRFGVPWMGCGSGGGVSWALAPPDAWDDLALSFLVALPGAGVWGFQGWILGIPRTYFGISGWVLWWDLVSPITDFRVPARAVQSPEWGHCGSYTPWISMWGPKNWGRVPKTHPHGPLLPVASAGDTSQPSHLPPFVKTWGCAGQKPSQTGRCHSQNQSIWIPSHETIS